MAPTPAARRPKGCFVCTALHLRRIANQKRAPGVRVLGGAPPVAENILSTVAVDEVMGEQVVDLRQGALLAGQLGLAAGRPDRVRITAQALLG